MTASNLSSTPGAQPMTVYRYEKGGFTQALDNVALEVPVAIVYNGISHAVMMTTPTLLEEYAIGFSLAEGIISSLDEVYQIEVRDACQGQEVHLEIASEAFWKLKDRRRSMTGRTGCGLCGTESLSGAIRPIQPLPKTQRFAMAHLDTVLGYLKKVEQIGQATGCTHAAAWVNPDGQLMGGAEDVGRHVALDKLLGMRARQGWRDGVAIVSSRASYEMVQKAAMCGVEILFAVSAPTQLAVEVAQASGLTLVAFCRPGRANIYSYPERIIEF